MLLLPFFTCFSSSFTVSYEDRSTALNESDVPWTIFLLIRAPPLSTFLLAALVDADWEITPGADAQHPDEAGHQSKYPTRGPQMGENGLNNSTGHGVTGSAPGYGQSTGTGYGANTGTAGGHHVPGTTGAANHTGTQGTTGMHPTGHNVV